MKPLLFFLTVVGLCFAQPRWVQMEPVPPLPSGRAVGDGAWLKPVSRPGGLVIYAAKGNRTSDFYFYDVDSDSWVTCADVPLGSENKTVDEGSRGTYDGRRYIYMSKGNSSWGFYRYDVTTNTWEVLPDIPVGPDSSRCRGGTDLVYVNRDGSEYVYLLKGRSGEFCRFDVSTQSWTAMPHAPDGAQSLWPYGSWLAYDGMRNIFAHKAGVPELWVFDVAGDTWLTAPRTGLPIGGSVGSGDGGSGEWHRGSIYALKGHNTPELWQYFVSGDSWRRLEDIPVGVGGGGALVRGDSIPDGAYYFYAFPGNNGFELWRYRAGGIPAVSERGLGRLRGVSVVPSPLRGGRGILSYTLSGAGVARLGLCDPMGRRLWHHRVVLPDSGQVPLLLTGLVAGPYFLMVETGSYSGVMRVVVTR